MCWKCGSEIKLERISRSDICPDCGKDLHSCRNCSFYSKGSHYDCHESIEDPVFDKEKGNFCDLFKVKRTFLSGSPNSVASKEEQMKKLNSLFNI